MKLGKILTSAVLTASMLVSLLGGGMAYAAGSPVALGQTAVFDPLSPTESIAYERHETGYDVSLDREPDNVTMNISAAPEAESDRAAWKARLYVDTGVELMRGVTYRVSYTLSAEQAQTAYDVHFDSSVAEDAYGVLYARSIAASGTDRVEYLVTPEAARGTLVLRLQLGNTAEAGNVLRFANLKVEEASASGGNVLADRLNYGTKGNISIWTNEDSRALLVGGEDSAKLTVLETPRFGAEVWKIKLLAATGLRPEAGKAYRVRADLTSTAEGEYEVCYNEGDFEKGYDVQYAQQLAVGTQTIDRTIYVPSDKENPGELILQFSLGKLAGGESVTVSNVRVEEAIPTYTSALSENFAFDKSETTKSYGVMRTENATNQPSNINWADISVDKNGDGAGALSFDSPDSVKLHVTPFGKDDEAFTAKLHILAGKLERNGNYLVSFQIQSTEAYSTYHVIYGSGRDGNKDIPDSYRYGGLYNRKLAENESSTVQQEIHVDNDDADLVIMLELGAVDSERDVTVSNLRIEKLEDLKSAAAIKNGSTFEDNPGNWTVGETSATLKVKGITSDSDPRQVFDSEIYLKPDVALSTGHRYRVKFEIKSPDEIGDYRNLNILYGTAEGGKQHLDINGRDGIYNQALLPNDLITIVRTFEAAQGNDNLCITLQCGRLWNGNELTVSNLRIEDITGNDDPSGTALALNGMVWGETPIADYAATLTRGADSAVFAVTKAPDSSLDQWKDFNARLLIRTGFVPDADKTYRVSFNLNSAKAQNRIVVLYGNVDNEKAYGEQYDNGKFAVDETKRITYVIPANKASGELILKLNAGEIDQITGNTFTVSDFKVEELSYSYTAVEMVGKTVSTSYFDVQPGYKADLVSSETDAAITLTEVPTEGAEPWKAKLFVDTGVRPQPGETYRVTVDVSAEKNQNFEICYNCDGDEKGFDAIYALNVAAGGTKTVEKVFTAERSGELIVQVSLGSATEPNTIRAGNLKVERITYTNTEKSALPAPLSYRTQSAMDFWAHEDYAAALTGSGDAATLDLTKVPASGAEAWKVKLFVHTNAVLRAGGFYEVTANLAAAAAQNVDVCYNNGDAEKGYGELSGVRLAKDQPQTVEKLIYVSPTREDLTGLTLQLNLGSAGAANRFTVSGVKVEEVPVTLRDAMPKALNYTSRTSVRQQMDSGYAASIERADGAATLHLTRVPRSGAEGWKAKLYVSTGARLAAGKTYLVTTNVQASKTMDYELCFNAGQREKGYDVLYGQKAEGGSVNTIERLITVPARGATGELILQFSVGSSPAANDITVSGVSVRELVPGAVKPAQAFTFSQAAVNISEATDNAAGVLSVSRKKLTYDMTKISAEGKENELSVIGAGLCAGETYAVSFAARADKSLTGEFALCRADGEAVALLKPIKLSSAKQTYSFVTDGALAAGGKYELRWRFGSAENQSLGSAKVELSDIHLSVPAQKISAVRSGNPVTVNGEAVNPSVYAIDGYNYFKLRDIAALLNGTKAQFGVQYDAERNVIAITTGSAYESVGGELTDGSDLSAQLMRTASSVEINGEETYLKAYCFGGNNYFRIRDLGAALGFGVDYDAETRTVAVTTAEE